LDFIIHKIFKFAKMTLLSLIKSPEEYMLPCLSKRMFDFECFGCGLQRSVVLLFQGNFIAAFKMYPAIYTLIPLFFLIVLNIFFKFKHTNKIINILAITSVLIIIISYFIKITN